MKNRMSDVRFIPARAGNTRPCVPSHSPTSVHPRSRGEHCPIRSLLRWMRGSSPLARGTRVPAPESRVLQRFIPARAGNTYAHRIFLPTSSVHPRSRGEHTMMALIGLEADGSSPLARGTRSPCPRRTGRSTVHPRSRGEHYPVSGGGFSAVGSSPLARGTHPHRRDHRRGRRFIPARAGNTEAFARVKGNKPVHPRSRGEHTMSGRKALRFCGSSPLARGTPIDSPSALEYRRFIPARAGNTEARKINRRLTPVHPRSRGEHEALRNRQLTPIGSSPLARGTQHLRDGPRDGHRFIPARAGNTDRGSGREAGATVHPRSRGEHVGVPVPHRIRAGSSPLARGTRHRRRVDRAPLRFIPARAGNTLLAAEGRGANPVHPRSRGEHPSKLGEVYRLIGSSPLARGTHAGQERKAGVGRFIPARAGNTVQMVEKLDVAYGSSPLARGTHARGGLGRGRERFIPARAGNTYTGNGSRTILSVHPRSRGEHSSRNSLINRVFFDDKERTDCSADNSKDHEAVRLALRSQAPVCSEQGDGMKRTSLKPSKSVGTRRFTPQVSKS